MAYTPEQIGQQVARAAKSVRAADPAGLANSVEVLLEDNNWRSYIDPTDRQKHEWDDFHAFVEKRLRTNVKGLVAALNHTPALAARVGDLGTANKGTRKTNDDSSFVLGGETRANGMRQLQEKRPDLAERVDAGVLSVHAAAVEAGFRKPRLSIRIDTPENAIKALLRVFSREDLERALHES